MRRRVRRVSLVKGLMDIGPKVESLVNDPLNDVLESWGGRTASIRQRIWDTFRFMPEAIGQAREQAEDDVDRRHR